MTRYSHTSFLRYTALSIALLLPACAVGPDYQKPDIALPEKWVSTDQQVSTAPTSVQKTWWQNFHDPILNQLIEKAAQGNLDIKIAEAHIEEARAARSAAGSALLPSGELKGSALRQANRIAFPGNDSAFQSLLQKPFNTFETGFDASWELDLFGGHRRDVEAATASMQATEASRDDVIISLLAEVARTYVDIRKYQAEVATAQKNLDLAHNTTDIAQQRFAAGDTAGIDVTQAKAQQEQTEAQIALYQNLLTQAEYSMDILLSEQPGAAHALVNKTAPLPAMDEKLVITAPSAVIANRPDIRVAERKLAAATAQQGVAVAQFFPDVSLTGFIGLLNTKSDNLLSTASKSWSTGASVLLPVLNYGSLSANLDTADAQQQEAMANYQKTIIGALSDVERSVTAYTEQNKYNQSLTESTDHTRHALAIAQERYKNGLTSFIEVLDAERTLNTSETQLTEANAQSTQNLIAVYKSLGGGWSAP